jgi:hypothetical protein
VTQGNTVFERGVSLGNLLVSGTGLCLVLLASVIWNNNMITMHSYRIDKLEMARTTDSKEILDKINDIASTQKAQQIDAALQHQSDLARDTQIKQILDRIERIK